MKMTETDAKAFVKAELRSYLEEKGINPSKPFHCIAGSHADRHPSMSFRNDRVKCFACGYSGDMFDVLKTHEFSNLSGKAFFDAVYARFGIEVEGRTGRFNSRPSPAQKKTTPAEKENYADYLAECAARVRECDYFATRGISAEVCARFGLGYDPDFRRGTGIRVWKAAIIPNGSGFIARNTDPNADDRNRYRKAGPSRLFNADVLFEDSDAPVWIVEGEIDALSVETAGATCVALGSVSNADQLISLLEKKQTQKRLIIAMDNDNAGKACAEKLTAAFGRLNIEHLVADEDIYLGKKDANAALQADAAAFAEHIRHTEMCFDEAAALQDEIAFENYRGKYSAQSMLDSFLGSITAATPSYPTGFHVFDRIMGGGLFQGLYCVGAISSLGKTTFLMQLADNLARQKQDVLIFSLEMSTQELIAKSLSRLTLKNVLDSGQKIWLAKSSRDITTADRYANYSDAELLIMNEAIRTYSETIADHVFIAEGSGEMGAAAIRQHVEEHISTMRCKPVVIVDYLQLLAPYSERMSDKQNVDRNVLELRRISRDFGIPLICISSFSRVQYNREANLASFKESGQIEYSADVLLAMQYVGIEGDSFNLQAAMQENPRHVELCILKNRAGRIGDKIKLKYYPEYNYFEEEA